MESLLEKAEDTEGAIDKLADMVISWQKMYNVQNKKMEKLDGKERFGILISDKQHIIDGVLGRLDEPIYEGEDD